MKYKYVLITAAHDEEDYIEKTIISVINQIQMPTEWIIVSDNSTDRTEEIVARYLDKNKFIKLIINKRNDGRDFASKVYALNIGIEKLSIKDFDFIGILDADVSFEPDFYSTLISEFEKNAKLGITGGDYYDIVEGKKKYIKPSPYSIRGATQFFRRECFEQIRGLKPLKFGGEDALACYTARMLGWEIKNIENLTVTHLRPTGITASNILQTRFREGKAEYTLGYNPLFQFIKCIKRIKEYPIIIGSLLRIMGYWFSAIKNENDNYLPTELKKFISRDQRKRIIMIFQIKKYITANFNKNNES